MIVYKHILPMYIHILYIHIHTETSTPIFTLNNHVYIKSNKSTNALK